MANEFYDQSHIEKKYFIDAYRYNCPFCNIRNVEYHVSFHSDFNWSRERKCYYYVIECSHCAHTSLHLSNYELHVNGTHFVYPPKAIKWETYGKAVQIVPIIQNNREVKELDDVFFYHQPTSFFTIDNRIPGKIRELVSEADGCLKMDYLVGASGCLRKAIYELLEIQDIPRNDTNEVGKETWLPYNERIKKLKQKFSDQHIDADYFDILASIQGMTSDALHEGSWDSFDSNTLKLLIETTKEILCEIYVLPEKRNDKKADIKKLFERANKFKVAE